MALPDIEVIANIQERTMPFKDDPPYAHGFYDAMGRMLLMWGRLEKALDDLLIVSVVIAGEGSGSRDTYVSLSRKLEILTTLFRNAPKLKEFHSRAVTLGGEIKASAKHRNLLIHASWVGFEDGGQPKLKMQNIKYKDDVITVNDFMVTVENLSRLCSNFHLCCAKIIALIADIQDIWKSVQS